MPTEPKTLTVKWDSPDAAAVRKALGSEQRARILSILGDQVMNVGEIAEALGVDQSTASVHIRVLEKAGLLSSRAFSTDKGAEKRCWATFETLVIQRGAPAPVSGELLQEFSMPVGLYTAISVIPPCGMTGRWDGPLIPDTDTQTNAQYMMMAERMHAENLWFTDGWVEYSFPCGLRTDALITAIEFQGEMCSEAPGYNNDWPSDITIWINGVEIGAWTCPGDFGGERGKLNPDTWPDKYTQYGILKTWRVDSSASYVDGEKCGSTCLSDLNIGLDAPLTVRVGIKSDSKNHGGLNLFGRHFGNHPQDLLLRFHYRLLNAHDWEKTLNPISQQS